MKWRSLSNTPQAQYFSGAFWLQYFPICNILMLFLTFSKVPLVGRLEGNILRRAPCGGHFEVSTLRALKVAHL
jgi:hypothetical protein